jgi:aspartate/methionine/tyrosine aminotransferase
MVIINPGNPTGQCLSEATIRELLRFCFLENLVLLADEVYQQNIYQDERPFISARKVTPHSTSDSSCNTQTATLVFFILDLWSIFISFGANWVDRYI